MTLAFTLRWEEALGAEKGCGLIHILKESHWLLSLRMNYRGLRVETGRQIRRLTIIQAKNIGWWLLLQW